MNEVTVGLSEPLEVAALHSERKLVVLPHRAVAHFVHLVELTLEHDKVSAGLRLLVDEVILKLLKRVYNLEEIAVVQEIAEVAHGSFLLNLLSWDGKRILVEIVL